MSALDIARALGGARREGKGWRCRCPLHGGRSLVLRDGAGGCILATCWGGCDRLDVLAELRRRGLLDGPGNNHRGAAITRREDRATGDTARTARALAVWARSTLI